ncbi:MAG: TIGR04372 family glycosyltransferase [Sulfuritalea sp.]|nr:TIGR04372 family glycosyltransferase [Sulfuritalea sp.]
MTLLSRLCAWIGDRTGTIVVIPHPIVVGSCAEQIYPSLLKARREGKKLVLLHQYSLPWPIHYRLTNHELIDIASEYKTLSSDSPWFVVGSALVTFYAAVARTLNLLTRRLGFPLSDADVYPCVGNMTIWQPKEIMPGFSWEVVAEFDWPTQVHTRLPVSLLPHKKAAAEHERVRLGLPADAWFVCLHVRESGFHNDTMTERNASISNYAKAIKEVTVRGGWVVRLGDPSMTRLPPMERVIDYPFTSSKSALMDIYMISECRAYIGMQSGVFDVATLFQKPIILTNMASWLYPFPVKYGDVGVFKHVYSKSRQRYLSVQEWMAEPFDAVSYFAPREDYVYHENSPEELRATVQEFFERNGTGTPTSLQCECSDLRQQRGRCMVENKILSDDPLGDLHNRYRVAFHLSSARGVISHEYLKKNWDSDTTGQA